MHRRTFAVLLGAILLLALASVGCSVGQLIARQPPVVATPTRTPRPHVDAHAGRPATGDADA